MNINTRCSVVSASILLAAVIPTAALAEDPRSADANPRPDRPEGVTVHTPQASAGYTLVAPMNSKSTYLIDLDGRIVHEWKSEYTPALSAYLLANGNLLRPGAERGHGHGGPGAGGRIQEFTWDGALVWDYSFGDGKLRPHHDICRLPNGNVLVIATDPKTRDEAIAAGRWPDSVEEQFLPDCILEIKPTGATSGEIVWQWNAWDHLIQDAHIEKPNYGDVAAHPERIDVNFGSGMMDRLMQDPEQLKRLRSLGYVGGSDDSNDVASDAGADAADDGGDDNRNAPQRRRGPQGGDWTHINFVAYNPEFDQIMLSVHEFSEIWVIDHSTTTAEAATGEGGRSGRGGDLLYRWGNPQSYRAGDEGDQRLFGQHCAHWIPEGLSGAGHVLIYNNGVERPDGAYSSVDELVLPVDVKGVYAKQPAAAYGPVKPVWSFGAPDADEFFSMTISGAQRLANGNTLVCVGNEALLFEVTRDGETVWRFQHPGGGLGGPPRPGEIVPGMLQDQLALEPAQRASIERLQATVDETLKSTLDDEQQRKLESPRMRPGAAPGRRGPGGRPGLGGFRPPRPGEVLPKNLVDELGLSATQRAAINKLQREVDKQLNGLWTDEQKATLKELERHGPRGFGPPPPGFGPPPGQGPRDGDGHRPPRGPGGLGGPGGPGGPGGIFFSFRYAPDHPGLADRALKPGKKLAEVGKPAPPEGAQRRTNGN